MRVGEGCSLWPLVDVGSSVGINIRETDRSRKNDARDLQYWSNPTELGSLIF